MGVPNWVQNQCFRHFLKVASLVSLDIAQDCSLGQCLTVSRAETSNKKKIVAQTGAEMIFSILVSSSVHSNLVRSHLGKRRINKYHNDCLNGYPCARSFSCNLCEDEFYPSMILLLSIVKHSYRF